MQNVSALQAEGAAHLIETVQHIGARIEAVQWIRSVLQDASTANPYAHAHTIHMSKGGSVHLSGLSVPWLRKLLPDTQPLLTLCAALKTGSVFHTDCSPCWPTAPFDNPLNEPAPSEGPLTAF